MGQKRDIMAQKWLKMHKKMQKIEFLDLKNLLFSGIFLSGIIVLKKAQQKGGVPPLPLSGQNPLKRF